MYYLLDKKSDETFTINFIGIEEFNIGNKLFLITPECIKGISKITSFTDIIEGENEKSYLKKFFRYKNGKTNDWSDTLPIDEISNIEICPNRCFQLEIIYLRTDEHRLDNQDNKILLKGVTINGEYDIMKSDSYVTLTTENPLQILEIGDLLKVFSIDAFEVISTSKLDDHFNIKYRFSQNDKRSWTKWESLTKENISTVKWNKLRFVELQYLFELSPNVKKPVKIYDVLLYGDFQNVTANYKKINKFGLKENCVNLAYKPSDITEQTSGIGETQSAKNINSNTQSLIKESSEYQLRMNWLTQGINCYSNSLSIDGMSQLDVLNAENEANSANFWNPYEFEKITNFHDMLAKQISDMLGMTVEYHLTDPDGNGTDRVIHEYQLHNIVDYKNIKILVPDNQFPDNQVIINQFNLDLFDTFKIHILKSEFKKIFGIGKRPGQEDILYFCQVNRMYIVKHAQIHKNIMNAGIYYDVVLEKYEKRSNIINKIDESKNRIEELTRNTTIDELFGFNEEQDFKKVANKQQFKPTSFDFIRKNINKNTQIIKNDIYNGSIKIIDNFYNLEKVKNTEVAIEYSKVDNKLLKSDNRSFIVWFNFPNEYDPNRAITKRVINGYDIDDNRYYFINNYENEYGYSIFYQNGYINFQLNDQIFKMESDVMTNVWFGLVVNLEQRQNKISMKLYRRNTALEVLLFNPISYEKLQLNFDDIEDIEYEMRVNGFRAVDNIETTSPEVKIDYIEINSYENNELIPDDFNNDINITIPGNKLKISNIRIFDDIINDDIHKIILSQLIIKDAQHLILGDNANDKLQTINHPNKQWR
ncbi:MAG: hypothetical protein WDA02_03080 [Saccharofermentanales bacterium]